MKTLSRRGLLCVRLTISIAFAVLWWGGARACYAGDVVFLRAAKDGGVSTQPWDVATRFYGLNLTSVEVGGAAGAKSALTIVQGRETLAVIATPAAVEQIPPQQLIAALQRQGTKSIPILIFGITPETRSREFASLSDKHVSGCQAIAADALGNSYFVGGKSEITRQLAQVELPAATAPSCGFSLADSSETQVLLSAGTPGRNVPVFVRASGKTGESFFLADTVPKGASRKLSNRPLPDIFSEIAPEMMFVRYAAAEKGWHGAGHYANLTLDDARLTEPYGHIHYEALLGEMEKHNFHTTIAFIPLNFDRNGSDTVSLFRAHPGRYSISIHGNNHDHREFGDYAKSPLTEQESNIEQAVARMERFKTLTGIPYDRVMVFPHGVAPSETFAALKKYNFLATANSEFVPLGSAAPDDDAQFFLRPVTLRYADFPSLLRYSAEIPVPPAIIAIQLFLDNPTLFYGHEMLFDEGIGAFNAVADEVNAVEPDVHWCGLQCVAQHLYVMKRRDGGGMDVQAFGSDLALENSSTQESTLWVEKQENFQPEIASVTVDGQPLRFERKQEAIAFQVVVPAMGNRHVSIEYRNNMNLASIDISRKNLYVVLVRRLAEFRDMTLSTWSAGRAMTKFYYRHNLDAYELVFEKAVPFLLLAAVIACLAKFIQKRTRSKHVASA